MKSKYSLIIAAVFGVSLVVGGVAAFTTADLQREATVQLDDDSQAIIGLTPVASGITTNDNGQLSIQLGQEGSGNGLNTDATFSYGDNDDPANKSAFTMTNNDEVSHSFTVNYGLDATDPQGTTENVVYTFYDENGNKLGQASEDALASFSLNSGQTAYVVVEVNTPADKSGDLSGTLDISAA